MAEHKSFTTYNLIAGQRLDRLTGLSDGVLAIAMTLLVFDIRLPDIGAIRSEQELWRAFVAVFPHFLMYLMSFLTLGIFWVGQHTALHFFARSDRDLAWIHIAFLAAVALVPLSTRLLAEFITYRTALLIYWANLVVLGNVLYSSWVYARHAGLLKKEATAEVGAALRRRIFVGQALYAAGAALCIISTYWSIAFLVLVQLNYAIAPRIRFLSHV